MSLFDGIAGQLGTAHDKADHALHLLESQHALLARLVQHADADVQRAQYQRIPFRIDTDGTGRGTIALQVPQGIAWDLVSMAGAGNQAGVANIYVGAADGTGLVAGVALSAAFTWYRDFVGEEYCPQGQIVTMEVTGQAANSSIYGNLRVNKLLEG